MSPSKAHHQAADVKRSLWVSAHAGTGKTYVLITRLVALLLKGVPPSKILCLTYMRAAAAEMRERLLDIASDWHACNDTQLNHAIAKRLGWQADDAIRQRARGLYDHALEHMQDFRIQTIHSFCQEVLHRFAIEAQLPPHFHLEDDMAAHARRRQIMMASIGGRTQSDYFARLSQTLKESEFRDLFEQVRPYAPMIGRPNQDRILAQLRKRLDITDTNYHTIIRRYLQTIDPDKSHIVRFHLEPDSKRLLALKEALQAELWPQAWLHWQKFFLTTAYDIRIKIRNRPSLDKELSKFETVFSKAAGALTYELSEVWQKFIHDQNEALRASKQADAVLDYDDLITKTHTLLHSRPMTDWVQYKLDEGIDHILLDEAQDTNPAQWGIIRALTEEFFSGMGRRALDDTSIPPSLFVVGDAKQSIVSFQGASIKHYHQMRQHYLAAPANMGEVNLVKSRRSGRAILRVVDKIFSVPTANKLLMGKDVLAHETACEHEGYVELWMPFGSEKTPNHALPSISPSQALATAIAKKVRSMCDEGQAVPGDIMILLRNRKPLMPLLQRAFIEQGIACSGPDRTLIHKELVVQDIMAIMEAALLPQNRLAFANFLRSPLGGASEDDLLALAIQVKTHSIKWAEALDRTTNAALKKAADCFVWARAHIDILPPYEFIMRLLYEQAGLEAFLKRLGPTCLTPIEELLNTALLYERDAPPSAQGFLHWIRTGMPESKNEMEQRSDNVRIMTIHAAKGLEAPIIFLPDMCRPSRPETPLWHRGLDGEMVWRLSKAQKGNDPSQQPPYLQEVLKQAQQARDEESARLLYVALTRARHAIYIGGYMSCGHYNVPPQHWYQWICSALGAKFKPKAILTTNTINAIATYGTPPALSQTEPVQKPQSRKPSMPSWATRPAPKETEAPLRLVAVTGLWDAVNRSPPALGQGGDFWYGRHAHFLLEHLPRLPVAQRAKRGAAWLAHHIPDIPQAQRDDLLEEVLALLDKPDLQDFFRPEACHEVPIIGNVAHHHQQLALRGRIDVMVELPDKILLGDYKTDHLPPVSHTQVKPSLLLQMAGYARLLGGHYPDKPIECWLIWTKTAHAMHLPASVLDDQWDKQLAKYSQI